jgi:hypothetical protein
MNSMRHPDMTPFQGILAKHQERYPLMQACDVYKLIHQASLGSEHAISNPQMARERLQSELQSRAAPHPEPAIDPISPDGAIVRVHLSAYMAEGGDFDNLLNAFLRTSHEFHGQRETLEEYLRLALSLVPGLDMLAKNLSAQGYPPVHHSEAYRAAYKPAYRVVLKHYL